MGIISIWVSEHPETIEISNGFEWYYLTPKHLGFEASVTNFDIKFCETLLVFTFAKIFFW